MLDMAPLDSHPGLGCRTAVLGQGQKEHGPPGRKTVAPALLCPAAPTPSCSVVLGTSGVPVTLSLSCGMSITCILRPGVHVWVVVLSWVSRCVGEPEDLLECAVPALGSPLSGAPPGKHIRIWRRGGCQSFEKHPN